MMRRARNLSVGLLVAISGCEQDLEFEKNDQYWRSEIKQFSESPRTAHNVESWLAGHEVEWKHEHRFTNGDNSHSHATDLQVTHKSTFRCTWRTTSLRFVHEDDGPIRQISVYDAGDCLW